MPKFESWYQNISILNIKVCIALSVMQVSNANIEYNQCQNVEVSVKIAKLQNVSKCGLSEQVD